MTLEQLSVVLLETGYPTAFQSFPKKDAPPMPYLIYQAPQANNFFADGIVFFSSSRCICFLYTKLRDPAVEITVETVLNKHQLPWTKDAVYDETEKCFEITYEIEV